MRIDSRILYNMAEWMEKREDIPKGWIYLGDDTEAISLANREIEICLCLE